MIIGLGSDLIDIRRIEKTLDRYGARFTGRVFTELERKKSERRATRAATYAKRFAAKEACAKALELCQKEGLTFLHPFDDAAVINGQGTIGLEMMDQVPGLEAVVIPIGGGGLISGVACAIKESNPSIRVIGVQTERLPSMLRAIQGGSPVTLPAEATIADGIAVRRAGDVTFPLVKQYVDEIVTVDEEEIAKAIMVLLEREKMLAEGAGAAALASLLQKKTSLKKERTAVLVCGGNIDVSLLAKSI
jgi:threonine dehydratase